MSKSLEATMLSEADNPQRRHFPPTSGFRGLGSPGSLPLPLPPPELGAGGGFGRLVGSFTWVTHGPNEAFCSYSCPTSDPALAFGFC